MIMSRWGPADSSLGPGVERRAGRRLLVPIRRQFEPIKKIGHSIYVYHLTADQIAGASASTIHGSRPGPQSSKRTPNSLFPGHALSRTDKYEPPDFRTVLP